MRPELHLTAPTGWMNDPHGITWHDGLYHAFYQYVPGRTSWASNCHWAHVTSPDLLGDWRDQGVALAPGDGDDGIWTGSLVVDDEGRARIFYTSVVEPGIGVGRVRTATPADAAWRRWDKGPVVVEAPGGLDVVAFRDPFVQRHGAGWTMYVGAGTADGTALALAWTSDDLDHWRYAGPALRRSTSEREPVWTGALWECPQLVEVDGTAVMVSSVWSDDVLHYAGYALGRFEGTALRARDWGRLSYGDSYYAPSFFRDRDGRPCLVFWMRGVRDEDAGWAGCHSVPYLMGVVDGRLALRPHPSLAHRLAVRADRLPGTTAGRVWTPTEGAELHLRARDEVVATLTAAAGELVLARRGVPDERMPVDGGDVLVLVDGPVLEVCASGAVLGGAIEPVTGFSATGGGLAPLAPATAAPAPEHATA